MVRSIGIAIVIYTTNFDHLVHVSDTYHLLKVNAQIFVFFFCTWHFDCFLAWFGGDPHVQTLSNTDYTCNVYGSFVYAETTTQAKTIAKEVTTTSSVYLKSLVTNELFSIIARTSKTPALLQVNSLYNQDMTYFSSFTMYLGLENNVIIDVSINPTNTYQFRKFEIKMNLIY
jgi:hypothetical protein